MTLLSWGHYIQDTETHGSHKHFSARIKTAEFLCNPLGNSMAHVTKAYVGASQRRPGWQGAWAVTFRLPGRVLLQQAAREGEWRVREEAGEESRDGHCLIGHCLLPQSHQGPTTNVTRAAEGRALAFISYKMALPPTMKEPRERGISKSMRELFICCPVISVGTRYNLGRKCMKKKWMDGY